MLLEGSIHRFGLVGLLQFLAMNEATGVVEVRDFEEYGFIYLVGGKVEGISLPVTDDKLGERLLKAGCLTEEQLAEALMKNAALSREEKKVKPLGQRLVEMGATSEATIREVMRRQTLDQVFELAQWSKGVFAYEEPADMPSFQIAIQGNVQAMLLDAQRRVDEGEHARKAADDGMMEVCFACPLEDKCSAVIKDKYLKSDVCLWRQMSAVVDDEHEGLRDSRRLYRSGAEGAEAGLEASVGWK